MAVLGPGGPKGLNKIMSKSNHRMLRGLVEANLLVPIVGYLHQMSLCLFALLVAEISLYDLWFGA